MYRVRWFVYLGLEERDFVGNSDRDGGEVERVGILRLRKPTRFAKRLAALRMTKACGRGIGVAILIACTGFAGATTYYVSSSAGSDANSGTSILAPWKTL